MADTGRDRNARPLSSDELAEARKVGGGAPVTTLAATAADAQHTPVPGQDLAASIVAEFAPALLELDQRTRAGCLDP